MRAAIVGCLLCLLASAGHAGGIEQLRSFHATTKSGTVGFKQSVAGKGPQAPRESSGTFSFQRPGKFRWLYTKPFEQLIVGDGEKVWVYDRDLNQVVVRKLDAALGSTPAALLAGDIALEENFVLIDGGTSDGLEYVEAKPKSPDTGFARVRIGFAQSLPRAMQLTDAFGNVTTLTFSNFERNPTIDPGQFRFLVPKGADVVGDIK
jgi:outer membrane lipoprotein carrier protein